MKHSKYQQQIVATEVCTKRMTESTKVIGQRYRKGATKYCFLFDSCLSSKKLEEAVMEAGANLIGMIKPIQKDYVRISLISLQSISKSFLPRVEEQAYGIRGQAAN